MLVAVFIVHLGEPFKSFEKALLFLVGFVVIILVGPGKYSFDNKHYKEIFLVLIALFFVYWVIDLAIRYEWIMTS